MTTTVAFQIQIFTTANMQIYLSFSIIESIRILETINQNAFPEILHLPRHTQSTIAM